MLRRIMAFALSLVLLGAAGSAATPVVTDRFAALVDDRGEALAEGVDDVFEVYPGQLYAVGRKGDYRLCDDRGNAVSERSFEMLRAAGGCVVYREDGFYGAMTQAGEALIEPAWTQLVSDGAGGFLALADSPLDDVADEIWHIAPGEEPENTGVSALGGLRDVSEDRMSFMTADGRWGCLDGRGKQVIEATWRYIGPFSEGVAAVTGDAGHGLIDREGGVVLEPTYAWLERGAGLVAARTEEGRLDIYDGSGRNLRFSVTCQGAQVVGGAVAAFDAEAACLYRADGSLWCTASPMARFAPGVYGQVIVADGKWGEACEQVIDATGRAVSPRRQHILPLCAGRYVWFEMSGATYFSAELGALQTSWDYESVRCGLMDDAGRVLLPAEYLEIRAVGEDRLLLIRDNGAILADADGVPIRSWLEEEEENTPPDAQ